MEKRADRQNKERESHMWVRPLLCYHSRQTNCATTQRPLSKPSNGTWEILQRGWPTMTTAFWSRASASPLHQRPQELCSRTCSRDLSIHWGFLVKLQPDNTGCALFLLSGIVRNAVSAGKFIRLLMKGNEIESASLTILIDSLQDGRIERQRNHLIFLTFLPYRFFFFFLLLIIVTF